MNWPAVIRNLTGMSQEQYQQLEFTVGMSFLEMMEDDKPELRAHLERSEQYWKWWRLQFPKLGREFINRNRLEVLRTINKDIVRARFEAYCSIVKVSDYGTRSYIDVALQAQRALNISRITKNC